MNRVRLKTGHHVSGLISSVRNVKYLALAGSFAAAIIIAVAIGGNQWRSTSSDTPRDDTEPVGVTDLGEGQDTYVEVADEPSIDRSPDPGNSDDSLSDTFIPETGSEPTDDQNAALEFTDRNLELLMSEPDSFSGHFANISGRVYEVVDQSSSDIFIITFKVFTQAIDSDDSRAVVVFQQIRVAGLQNPGIEIEDCLVIEGKVRGGFGVVNSLGNDIRVPLIDASRITKMECIDSALPALKTIELDVPQSLGGITLTAHRVQIAEDHIRIKITAENIEGGDGVYIREKESFATLNGTVHQNISHLPVYGNFRLDSRLSYENPSTGYVFFERLQTSDEGPISFRIIVEKVGISGIAKSTFIFTA